MEIVYATEPGSPDRPNEDYVVCGPAWIAVFDGATAPAGVDSGCVHDVAWLVRRLASAVAARMPVSDAPLADILSAAIASVRRSHGQTCDLANPDSPSSTASLCRVSGSILEYLVLADSPIVVRHASGEAVVIRDGALDHLPGGRPYTRELVRSTRNQPGGFWVASTVPEAAYHGVNGAVDIAPGIELAVLTDGASRFAEVYGHAWEDLLTIAAEDGPRDLIARVRALEDRHPPPGKRHDDATAVYGKTSTGRPMAEGAILSGGQSPGAFPGAPPDPDALPGPRCAFGATVKSSDSAERPVASAPQARCRGRFQ